MNALLALRPMVRRWRRWGISMACLVALYAVAGFLVLPRILESMIPDRAGRLLGRQVSIERVRTNPFTLSITLDGLKIQDPDGAALLSWDRLYLNAELWPLLKKRVGFKVVDLERLHVRVLIGKGGRLNFSDILDRFTPNAASPAQTQAKPMGVAIGRLRVANAQLSFEDQSQTKPFSSMIGPITIDLDRFRTESDTRSPYAFRGSTEAGESFAWSGILETQPLRSSGILELTALQLPKYLPYYWNQLGCDLHQGKATIRAAYDFEWSGNRHAAKILDGSLAMQDLTLLERKNGEASILLPSIQVTGINADLLQSSVEIAGIALKDGKLSARRDPGGHLNLQTMFTTPPKPAPEKPSAFKLHVQELSWANYGLELSDLTLARPVHLKLDRIEGSLKDLNLEPSHVSPLTLGLRIGEKGELRTEGSLALLKASGELTIKLDGLDLPALDPYLDSFADIRLNRGKLGLSGRMRFAFEGKKDDGFNYLGDLQVSDFEARDSIQNEPFLRWKRLKLSGTEFKSQRPHIALKSVDWVEPEGRLVMARDGISNVARALRLAPAGPIASAVPPSPQEGPQPLIRIARMHVANGRLSFIDRSLEPNASLLLSGLEGVYTGLSTEAEEATLVDFKGKAGGFAPITIKGKAMPLRHDKDTDVSLKIVGADLTDFSPYTGKYLGYTTREGKLDVDAHVRIQDRKLNVEDTVRLDRMYLGDKVDSPDATHLPVKLGLAILRDRKGVITLEVPVDGSLDDPDIHYGKLIWHAILNVMGKIVTSPFTLLSKMFGSGEDLSSVAFTPGDSGIPAPEQRKLDTLIKALTERPELKLDVEGTTDAADLRLFKQRGLDDLLLRLKAGGKGPVAPGTPALEPAERERWMRKAFEAAFPPPKGTKVEPPPLTEVEQRMLESIQVDPNELRQLADARSKAAIQALLQGGQVDQSRVFQVEGGEAAKAGGPKVYFTLK